MYLVYVLCTEISLCNKTIKSAAKQHKSGIIKKNRIIFNSPDCEVLVPDYGLILDID